MLKKNKGLVILTSVIILLPMVAGLLLWNRLPENMITHWGGDGAPDGWGSREVTIFVMPLLLLGLHWLCLWITSKDPKNKGQSEKAFGLVFWIVPILSLFTAGITYSTALGREFQNDTLGLAFLGLIFVIIGNYLPKTRQNYTLGIKVKWTLANEENWYATHRMAGKVWMVGGVLLVPCVFLPIEIAFLVFFVLLLVMILVPTIYSWRYYKKQVSEGSAPEKAEVPMTKNMKTVRNVILIATGVLVAGLMLFIFVFAGFEIRYDSTSFTVEATGFSGTTVNYRDIDSVEYLESCQAGMRTYGFGDVPVQMGIFTNDEFGSYTRFGYPGSNAAVVLRIDAEVLVLTGKSDGETKEIYDELMLRMGEK